MSSRFIAVAQLLGFATLTPTYALSQNRVRDKKVPLVLYCRSGHPASQTYLSLRSLGFENVRVHTGSMLEYLQDSTAPLKLGPTP